MRRMNLRAEDSSTILKKAEVCESSVMSPINDTLALVVLALGDLHRELAVRAEEANDRGVLVEEGIHRHEGGGA